MPARRFDGNAVNRLEPALKPGMAGGWLYESDAHLRPDKLMSSLRKLLMNRGVDIRERCEVLGIEKRGRLAASVATTLGSISADAFVFATGDLDAV